MQRETEKKMLLMARHILKTGDTLRTTARIFSVSKSQVHKLLHDFLKETYPGLYEEVQEVMTYHQKVKHLRGGEATREKYRLIRLKKNS